MVQGEKSLIDRMFFIRIRWVGISPGIESGFPDFFECKHMFADKYMSQPFVIMEIKVGIIYLLEEKGLERLIRLLRIINLIQHRPGIKAKSLRSFAKLQYGRFTGI